MRLTATALGSAALAAVPLVNVVSGYMWAWQSALVLTAMGVAGALLRRLRAPAWAASAVMAATALLVIAWLFAGRHPGALVHEASAELHRFAAPVSDHDGVRFLVVAGIAALGLLVDALVVELGRPALAGLPMLAVYTVPVASLPGSTDWLPFALGALGFVWLLGAERIAQVRRFGRRIGGGRPGRLSVAAASRLLGLIGVALAVTLPFLLPAALPTVRPWAPGAGTPASGDAGSVDMLALLSGELNRAETVELLEVTDLDDAEPGNLRMTALEQLTSRGFEPLPPGAAAPVAAGLPGPGWGPAVRAGTHRAEIRIGERFSAGFLPVYGWPTGIRGIDPSWLFDPRTQMVYSERRTTANLRYTVDYRRPEISPDELRRAPAVDAADPTLRDVLAAPPNLVVRSLVPGLVEGRTNELDKVIAIRDFFAPANHFVYDTSTGPDTGGTAIVDFLRNRRGFCTQYAAAFAWLLREAGIPARVAVGFAGHRGGRTTRLTNHDLHAWTEVYFPAYGWLPFDATPPGAAGSVRPGPSAPATAAPPPVTAGPAATATQSPGPARPRSSSTPAGSPATWAAGGLLVALLGLPALTRARTRRRRLAATGAARAHEAWAELLDTMADYRVVPGRSDTPRAVARALAGLGAPAEDGARMLRTAEEHARYAGRPLPADDLRAALRAVRAGLAGPAGRRARFTAAVLPPSVLRRWRSRVAAARRTRAR